MMYWYGNGYGMGWFGWIGMVLWWILVACVIAFIARWFMHHRRNFDTRFAEDILKERYAKGEIDRKEFEERMKDIKNA